MGRKQPPPSRPARLGELRSYLVERNAAFVARAIDRWRETRDPTDMYAAARTAGFRVFDSAEVRAQVREWEGNRWLEPLFPERARHARQALAGLVKALIPPGRPGPRRALSLPEAKQIAARHAAMMEAIKEFRTVAASSGRSPRHTGTAHE